MSIDYLPTRVTLGGIVLNAEDEHGATWALTDLDGWHNGPGVEVEQVQRVVTHGQFDLPGHRSGRLITVDGGVIAPNRNRLLLAARSLSSLFADGGFATMTVADTDDVTLTARVQLVARPEFEWLGNTGLRFQLQLLAPDPYRYGQTSSASTTFASEPDGVGFVWPGFPDGVALWSENPVDPGSLGVAVVTNHGDAAARPVFKVSGPSPADGFRIAEVGGGTSITFLGFVPDGSQLVIDAATAMAVIDGVADRSGDVVIAGGWPTVPAGGSREYLFQSLGDIEATVLTVEAVATYW